MQVVEEGKSLPAGLPLFPGITVAVVGRCEGKLTKLGVVLGMTDAHGVGDFINCEWENEDNYHRKPKRRYRSIDDNSPLFMMQEKEIYSNTYWVLGDGAEKAGIGWIAGDPRKEIVWNNADDNVWRSPKWSVWSSPRAVQLAESGCDLSPCLPIFPGISGSAVVSHRDISPQFIRLGITAEGFGGIEHYEYEYEQEKEPALERPEERKESEKMG